MAINGNFRQLLVTFGNFGQFMAINGNFWQILTIKYNFWKFVAINGLQLSMNLIDMTPDMISYI